MPLVPTGNPHFAGRRPHSSGGAAEKDEEAEWAELDRLFPPPPATSEIQETRESIGVHPRTARLVAFYIAMTSDVGSPLSMWQGLQECTRVSPSLRRRWLRRCCATRKIPLEPWHPVTMDWE